MTPNSLHKIAGNRALPGIKVHPCTFFIKFTTLNTLGNLVIVILTAITDFHDETTEVGTERLKDHHRESLSGHKPPIGMA